jgi:UDP-N-acetylglucosamine:LPS N-acetylglucosamine transferase
LTTSEACYAGIPSINIPRFGTQATLMQELIDNGLTWFMEKNELGNLQGFIMDLISDKFVLMNTHLKLKSFQDGLGARRIVDSILEHQVIETSSIT